jgi:hypothetical protein
MMADLVDRGTTRGLDTTRCDGAVVVPPFPLRPPADASSEEAEDPSRLRRRRGTAGVETGVQAYLER